MPTGTPIRQLHGHRVRIKLGDFTIRVMIPLDSDMFSQDQLEAWHHAGDGLPGAVMILLVTYQYQLVAVVVLDDEHQSDEAADEVIHGLAAKFGRQATITDGPPAPPRYVHFQVQLPPGATSTEIASMASHVLGRLLKPGHDPGE